MEWIWRKLAQYVRATTAIELSGISAEELSDLLHQDALERLKWVEAVVFNEEINSDEKVQAIQAWFLTD